MNRLLQQQQTMQRQMLEHQALMLAARQRDMLGAAWFDDQAQKAGLRRLRAGTAASPAQAAERGWSASRILFWVAAALVAARVLASL